MSRVRQAIEINAPLHAVYEQLTAVENYPQFMSGVEQVTQIGDHRSHWVMDVDGKRREFDAEITELFDKRVSWSTMDGPRLAETLTMRPLDESHTQLVAQLEADIAFLLPSDRHGQETLSRRLKADLTAFKGMVENGAEPGRRIGGRGPISGGAAGTAPMGGRMRETRARGDGRIHEEERGSAQNR